MRTQPDAELRTSALTLAIVALLLLSSGCTPIVQDYGSATIFGRTTSGLYDSEEPYVVNLMSCQTELQPTRVTSAATAGYFFNQLSTEFPTSAGWSYTTAAAELSDGSIRIKTYDAQGTSTRVGAEIHVVYRPDSSDPSTNIHWIQVLQTNHSLQPPAGHGNSATYVDIFNANTTPYYDELGAADSGNCAGTCDFYDFPGRVDAQNDHNWEATTFLVQGPAVGSTPGAITFLRPGFRWGWVNDCEPIFGFPGLIAYLETEIAFRTADPFTPGGTVRLQPAATPQLVLQKGETEVRVQLAEAGITFVIGRERDPDGYYPISVSPGVIQLGSYDFPGETLGQTFRVEGGSGYIHLEAGEASIQLETVLEGAEPLEMVFTGTARVDVQEGMFVLDVDTKGIERLPQRR